MQHKVSQSRNVGFLTSLFASITAISLLFIHGNGHAAGPKISGFIDTTYTYNFEKPLSQTNAFRSYDAANDTVLLNNAQVTIEGELEEGVGYYVETNYGSDAAVNISGGAGAADDFDLQEAFLTYRFKQQPGDFKFDLKAGKFVTMQGIEVIESKDNYVISRGFLYGLAEAFTHVGGLVTVSAPKILSVSAGFVNGWDLNTDNNTGKTLVSRVGLDFGKLLNGGFVFYYGPEQAGNISNNRASFDTTWFSQPLEKLDIAFQFNAGSEEGTSLVDVAPAGEGHWLGFTIQPKYTFNDMFSIGARYEYFDSQDGDRATSANPAEPAGLILQNITVAPGIQITESLLFRVEYRYDWSSEMAFETNTGVFTEDKQQTVATQFIYTF